MDFLKLNVIPYSHGYYGLMMHSLQCQTIMSLCKRKKHIQMHILDLPLGIFEIYKVISVKNDFLFGFFESHMLLGVKYMDHVVGNHPYDNSN